MSAAQVLERRVLAMDDPGAAERGVRMRQRRERLGMSVRELAKEAGGSRDRLAKIEAGDPQVRASTVGPFLATLDRLEAEMSMDLPEGTRRVGDPAEGLIEIRLGDGPRSVVVKGPVANVDVLRETARDLIRDFVPTDGEPEG